MNYDDQAYVELQIQEHDVTGSNTRDYEWYEINRRALEDLDEDPEEDEHQPTWEQEWEEIEDSGYEGYEGEYI
mgnify:CR=1 FL=1